jgi:hypothetical protein
LFYVFITHPDRCTYRDCTGQYGGKVRINDDVRTTLLREKTSLSKLPGRTKSRQRSCFKVSLADLAIGVVGAGDAGVAVPQSEYAFGRIVSFLAIPAALRQASTGSVLARVRLYTPVPLLDVQIAATAAHVELWHHNYTFINRLHYTTHLLPAHLIGKLVVVMPHVQRTVAKMGYCLVLQEA